MHETEKHLTMAQAARISPGCPSPNCVWRWCRHGVKSRSGERVRLRHSGLVGIIGRELRYDESLLLRADIDFCLQSFIRDRIVLCDGRYVCQFGLFAGKGGNSILRSKERHERETAYLKRKWGKYLDVVNAKDTTRIVLHVERTGRGSAKR